MLLATILFVGVLWVFRPALDNDFINYDDPEFTTENYHVQHGLTWNGIQWAFHAYRETANWHPLTWLSLMADSQFFGLSPWGYHMTNVLLHTVNTVLLFLILRMLTKAEWRSFVVAALFGLHPLRVESVAWIAERKDVLSVLFLLLTLWAYTKFVAQSSAAGGRARGYYGLALVFYVLCLMLNPRP